MTSTRTANVDSAIRAYAPASSCCRTSYEVRPTTRIITTSVNKCPDEAVIQSRGVEVCAARDDRRFAVALVALINRIFLTRYESQTLHVRLYVPLLGARQDKQDPCVCNTNEKKTNLVVNKTETIST